MRRLLPAVLACLLLAGCGNGPDFLNGPTAMSALQTGSSIAGPLPEAWELVPLAEALDLPVIVHDRDAHGDCLDLVRAFPNVRGVFHCYSGAVEEAKRLLDRGWYLGFDGPVTFKNARRAPEVAAVTPLDRIVVETDAPYMSPVPNRGRRNDSRNLPYIVEKLAEWNGVTPEEMTEITWQNGLRLFGLEVKV